MQTQVGRGVKMVNGYFKFIDDVTAFGERNPKQESYFRYCNSHNVKIYNEQFLDLLKSEIISDWENGNISYVSSPYFSMA